MAEYQVINPAGTVVLQAPESCRSSRRVELDQLEHGYSIRLHGKRITKTDLKRRRTVQGMCRAGLALYRDGKRVKLSEINRRNP